SSTPVTTPTISPWIPTSSGRSCSTAIEKVPTGVWRRVGRRLSQGGLATGLIRHGLNRRRGAVRPGVYLGETMYSIFRRSAWLLLLLVFGLPAQARLSDAEALNTAGLQRMLSQRTASAYLMLGAEV